MSDGANLTTSRSSPVVDFTSADFESIKADMQSYAQAKYSDLWTAFNPTDPGVIFLELTAYLGDLLTYQLNSVIRELWAATVLRKQNLINIGKPFLYEPKEAEAATVIERFTLDPAGPYPVTLDTSVQVSNDTDGDAQVFFQPIASTLISSYPVAGYVDVECKEGEVFSNVLIGVSGNTPSQRWQFPQQNILKSSISVTVSNVSWSSVANFATASSTSNVYTIVQTDDGNTFAVFGDGVFGAIPPNTSQIRATFRVGGGRRGNLNAGTITRKVSVPSYVTSVTNPGKSDAGDDAQTMRAARQGLPGVVSTQNRAVNESDHERLILNVSGVAKVRCASGIPAGSNQTRIWVAPSGGGQPTPSLKNAVSTFMKTRKMVGRRLKLYGPVYKQLQFVVLLHVNENFRPEEVKQAARAGLINPTGTGLLDFDALDFSGVSKTSDGNEELLLGQTRLQAYFDSLRRVGLDRAEILQLTVKSVPRAKDTGNTGNGLIDSVAVTSRQRRRQFFVELISSAQYRVFERIIGRVSALADSLLTDSDKDFSNEGINSFAGFRLVPSRDLVSDAAVASASDQSIIITGGSSLFTLTEVGNEYYLYDPAVDVHDVGSTFISADGNVSFRVSAGTGSFIAGDSFTLDVFPNVSDIRLASDEYPELDDGDFTIRTSGGSRV